MNACNFEYLLQFVKRQLDLDKKLKVYDHLKRCDICRDAVCQISSDLEEVLFIYCAHCVNLCKGKEDSCEGVTILGLNNDYP